MIRRIAIELLVAVMIGSVLGLLGPFESYRLAIGPRIAYWIFMIIAGLAIFRPTLVVSDWLAEETGLPRWASIGLAIGLGSLPMTLLVAWLFSGFDVSRAILFDGLPLLYGQVLLISLLTRAVYRAIFGEPAVQAVAAKPMPTPVEPVATLAASPSSFAARLPPGFGPLRALGGEDHYVRAYDDAGSALILIRLRDAIAELGGSIAGEQVHRSWWVARDAVAARKNDGRTTRLVLVNGLEVPVSRERVAELKSAVWF